MIEALSGDPSQYFSNVPPNSSPLITSDVLPDIEPFESLKITTITLIISLSGYVFLDEAFALLPITRIELPPSKRVTQKFKIPHCKIPGSILSLRYNGYTKGIIRTVSKKAFKNSITCDISTREKNVSLKLSRTKMQMCGASSVEQGIEGANYIISHLNNIQEELNYMSSHPEKTSRTIIWLKEVVKGKECQRYLPEMDMSPSSNENLSDSFIDPVSKNKDSVSDYLLNENEEILKKLTEEIDERIVRFLLKYKDEFRFYSDFCAELDWISNVKTVISQPLQIEDVCTAMVNYNYDLGFDIKRYELVTRISGLNGFYARYNNSIEHNVTIELPYDVPEKHRTLRRKNKKPCHTFLVYKSGLVTQSGPGKELMRDAYYLFMTTILQIREYIIKPGIPRKLKYKRVKMLPNETRSLTSPENSKTGDTS